MDKNYNPYDGIEGFIQDEIARGNLQYVGGSVLGDRGNVGNLPDPSQLIETPKPAPHPVHPGIEWRVRQYNSRYADDEYYEIFKDNLNIEFNPESGGYGFYIEYDGDWYFREHCTPETIDAIIAKLEHFKRVVFGEGK